jgi:polygalacturonase
MRKNIISLFIVCCAFGLSAQTDFKASIFGCMSDGITSNTQSIQTAVNTISERGGGSLHFYVGRYLTGTVYLKNNVTLVLHEGATLVGLPSAYDYFAPAGGQKGLVIADGQNNIGVIGALPETPSIPSGNTQIIGMGVIQGWGAKVQKAVEIQREKGYLKESAAEALPALISFSNCTDVKVTGLDLQGAAGDVQVYRNCKNVMVGNLLVSSREVAGSKGIVFGGCEGITVTNNFFDVSGKPILSAGNSKNVKTGDNKTKAGALSNVAK